MAKDIKIAKIVKKLQDEGNFDKENFDKASMEEPTDDFDQALEAPLSDNEFAEPSESLKAAGIETITPIEGERDSFLPPEAFEPGQGNPLSVKNVRALRGLPPLEEEQPTQLPTEPQVEQAPTQVQPQPETAPVAQPVQSQPITPEQQEEQNMFAQEQALLEKEEKTAKARMISEVKEQSDREQKYKDGINDARKNIDGASVFQSGTVFQKILAGLSLFAGALGGKGAETMAIFKANEKAIIDRNQDLINKYTAQLGDSTKAKIAIRQDYYDTVDKIIDQKIQMASPAMQLNLKKLKLEIADKNARIDQYISQKTAEKRPLTSIEAIEAMPDLKERKEKLERVVLDADGNFIGLAVNKERAAKVAEQITELTPAIDNLGKLKEYAKQGNIYDLSKRAEVNSMLDIVVGLMRVPVTGPGILTETERKMLKKMIGNPNDFMSLKSVNLAKLNTVQNFLKKSIDVKMRVAGVKKRHRAPGFEKVE